MRLKLIVAIFGVLLVHSCSKYLERPVTSNLTTIDSLSDCERLLNNYELFGEQPLTGELSSDNYYIKPNVWNAIPQREKNIHIWAIDIFAGQGGFRDYNNPYLQINTANEIIKAIPQVFYNSYEQFKRDMAEGSAYFFRALATYNVLQLFARPYNASTAATDTGVAINLVPDVMHFRRSTMHESYTQVIADLSHATKLLPLLPDAHNRHLLSKVAVWALLARVHLSMGDYMSAEHFSDTCLQHYGELMDYNTCNPNSPFAENSPEVIWQASLNSSGKIIVGRPGTTAIVDSVLVRSYEPGDLRLQFFYRVNNEGNYLLNHSYTGGLLCFAGLATDEVLLLRAECWARRGNYQPALDELIKLLTHRYRSGTAIQIDADNSITLLNKIWLERRKELAFRGQRWTDLRRLNKERPGSPLRRTINGATYQLPPNDLRYTLPIPPDGLIGGQMVQNPRN